MTAATPRACAGTVNADEGACAAGVGLRSIQSNTERSVSAAVCGCTVEGKAARAVVPAVGPPAAAARGAVTAADATARMPCASAGPEDVACAVFPQVAPSSAVVRTGPSPGGGRDAGCRGAAAADVTARAVAGDIATGPPVAVPLPGHGLAVSAGMCVASVSGTPAAGRGGWPAEWCPRGGEGRRGASVRACVVADASASVGSVADVDVPGPVATAWRGLAVASPEAAGGTTAAGVSPPARECPGTEAAVVAPACRRKALSLSSVRLTRRLPAQARPHRRGTAPAPARPAISA